MKKLMLGMLIASAPVVSFGLEGSATAVSDYIWRGQSQSGNQPAIQGSLTQGLWKGGSVSGWASTLSGSGQEIDITLAQEFTFKNVTLSLGGIYYHYNRIATADTMEYFLGASAYGVSLTHYLAPEDNAFGTGSSDTSYTNLSYVHELPQNWSLKVAVGWSDYDGANSTARDFADFELRGTKSISETHQVFLGWTATKRKAAATDLNSIDEDNVVIGINFDF